jgi:hypothetical protein
MALPEIRPATDPLTTLEKHIQQSEDAGGNLETVVAGHQNGKDFNFVSFAVPEGANQQPPKVTLVVMTAPVDTTDQMDAVRTNIEAGGKTLLFLAPIFDAGTQKMIAVCRDGPAAATIPVVGVAVNVPAPGAPANVAIQATMSIQPDPTSGSFHGNSSHTTGLAGTATTYADGTVVRDGRETMTAVRNGNLGPKAVQQMRTKKDGVELVQQAGYCWSQRQLPDAILVENFAGFPAGTKFVTGKASEFGKHDTTDEGTGSELLKVVQTNSEIFGCSLKESILTAAFGTPLKNKPDLLRAQVEIFNPDPKHKKFARVPIVDVGPREDLEAVIDLTFQLDKFLGTDGSAKVHFRIVV